MELAGKHYQEGIKLFRQELYKGALDAFKRAHKLAPKFPKPVFNIAKTYEKLGISDQCVEWYGKYISIYKQANGADPPDIADIKNTVTKCKLGMRLEITVESDPKGAEVYIDSESKLAGTTPYKTRLDPGEHRLIVKAPLHAVLRRTIVVRKGESTTFSFKLDKLKTIGNLVVRANVKGATIFVDGKPEGRTPRAEPIPLNQRTYQVSVEKQGYQAVNRTVEVRANETVTVEANLWLTDPPSTWKEPLGWSLLSVGLLGVGAGVAGFWLADEQFTGSAKFRDYEMMQNLGYGIGGGLLGIGLALLIWEAADASRINPEDAQVTAFPMPTVDVRRDSAVVGTRWQF